MPAENYNYTYDSSGVFTDLNKICYSFDVPEEPDVKLNEVVTFKSQTYYRATLTYPNKCCCCNGSGSSVSPSGCIQDPTPQPQPKPEPEPDDCNCFTGVECEGFVYKTIKEALENAECPEEILVGCGTYELPLGLRDNLCIKGVDSSKTFITTAPGYTVVDNNVSILNVTVMPNKSGDWDDEGIVVTGDRFYIKNAVFNYGKKRASNISIHGNASLATIINCDFSNSTDTGVVVKDFSGEVKITSCAFNNKRCLDINSPASSVYAELCGFIGQVTYVCEFIEFKACEFNVGMWTKVNINSGADSKFKSCVFDNSTDTGWKNMKLGNEHVRGIHLGCCKEGIYYYINDSTFSDGKRVSRNIVLLCEGVDEEPGGLYINGEERELGDDNWGQLI